VPIEEIIREVFLTRQNELKEIPLS